jgi:hypothetical protein
VSERGVFAIDRGIWDHPSFANEVFTEREAWIWLIGEAAFKPHRRRFGIYQVGLARGQYVTSIRFLADKWGWDRSKVERFLKRLKNETMITANAETGITLITIRNYNKYQRVSLPNETPSETQSKTVARQQRDKVEDKENKEDTKTLSQVSPSAQKRSGFARLGLGTPLPADWAPDEDTYQRVIADFGMTSADINTELPAFHAYNVSNGVLSPSWPDTFYLFCKRWREHRDKQAPPRLELTESSPKRREDDWPPDYLEQFWASYPLGRKIGKKAVGAKLDVIRRRGDVTFERLMAGLRRYVDSRPDPKFTKSPEVWLNKGCWDDELFFKGTPDGKTQTAIDLSKLGFAGYAALGRRTAASVERSAPEDLEPSD